MTFRHFGLILTTFFIATNVFAAPLSCAMKGNLAETASMLRDVGAPKSDVQKVLKDTGDLTDAEISALLNFVYTPTLKGTSPKKMGQIAYETSARVSK